MDSEWESVSKQPATSPNAAVSGRNMCYIIFTSGSTGRPKGAVLQHAGVTNYLHCLTRCACEPDGLESSGSMRQRHTIKMQHRLLSDPC